jgi:hypothetical protein
MAKRKAARATSRKAAGRTGRSTKAAGKRAAKKTASRSRSGQARSTARAGGRKASRKATARKTAAKSAKSQARTTAARKTPIRKTPARHSPSRTTARKTTARKAPARAAAPATKRAPRTAAAPKDVVARKVPALDRARRRVEDDDIVLNTPPSSLNMDRSASSARSGRKELRERFDEHTETSPALTGGDVDADWESASTVGDEAPGGDNPTPDQDIVDDIGRALGVEYQDNEELKGEKKISDRDKHRWELDPASSEDYDDRD